MRRAGFVLVGGRSSRMGRDKALLEFRGARLVDRVAAEVRAAAGSVTLIGPPHRYEHLPYPVVADRHAGAGPLAGIHAALSVTEADWNLVAACDMPALSAGFLEGLLVAAESAKPACLIPVSLRGPEPLCAVYHRHCLAAIESLLGSETRKLVEAVDRLGPLYHPVQDVSWFTNVNTPEEWASQLNSVSEDADE